MKRSLYETLIGTDARLAITITGEELKEFIEDVMSDARLKAESEESTARVNFLQT